MTAPPHGISASRPRRCRDSSERTIRVAAAAVPRPASTQVRIFKAYPFGWRVFAISDADEPAVLLGDAGATRPDYNVIAEVLAANKIEPKIFRDVGRGKPLVQGAVGTRYEDVVGKGG